MRRWVGVGGGSNALLPDTALLRGIHWCAWCAAEFAGKVIGIGERTDDPVSSRTVDGRVELVAYRLGSHGATPDLTEVQEKELRSSHIKAWQGLLLGLVGMLT